ncbi:Ger(x)C family spore germination protein [Massilibacterium senegalense]|uniref:Ger(x)C family spore germination protein n=1 Tax=Massilibacterium senegalense TaxID=1632858 RepID=UPI0007818299|nr:Ger(x)C family spore germination protein [Massilibacterium senegalense]
MRKKIVLLLCITLFLLTGCWNAKDIEKMFYIQALGIDYKDGKYYVYAQILNFAPIAKQETVGGEQKQPATYVAVGVGSTYAEASHDLFRSSSRRIYWGHLRTVVFTERMLQHGVRDILDLLNRYHETRYTAWIFSTDEPLKKIFSVPPMLEMSPAYSKLGDPLSTYTQYSYLHPVRLHRFVSVTNEESSSAIIPRISIKEPGWGSSNKKEHPSLQFNGVQILQKFKTTGKLSYEDSIGFRWLTPSMTRGALSMEDNGKTYGVAILESPDISIFPIKKGRDWHFYIKIKMKANITEFKKDISKKQIEKMLEKKVKEQIMHTYLKGIEQDEDVYQLSRKLQIKHFKEWKKVQKDGKIPLSPESIESIDISIFLKSGGKDKLIT